MIWDFIYLPKWFWSSVIWIFPSLYIDGALITLGCRADSDYPTFFKTPLFHHVINTIGLLQYVGIAQCLSDILRISEMRSIIACVIGDCMAFWGNGRVAILPCLETLSSEPNDTVCAFGAFFQALSGFAQPPLSFRKPKPAPLLQNAKITNNNCNLIFENHE
jgi:hypothetical protein